MKKSFSKLLSCFLIMVLIAQTTVPTFANTTNDQSGELSVKTNLSLPNEIYAGVEYNAQAVSVGGELTNEPYV